MCVKLYLSRIVLVGCTGLKIHHGPGFPVGEDEISTTFDQSSIFQVDGDGQFAVDNSRGGSSAEKIVLKHRGDCLDSIGRIFGISAAASRERPGAPFHRLGILERQV